MSQVSGQLFKRVIQRIKQYKAIMGELGYSQSQILFQLAHLLNLDMPQCSSMRFSLANLAEALAPLLATGSKKGLADILINLQIEISQLQDEDSDNESQKIPVSKGGERKDKGKKKANEKKKGKKGKQTALQVIRQKAIVQARCQKSDIIQNLQKIELLKQFLERKVLVDLCQQPLSVFPLAPHVWA